MCVCVSLKNAATWCSADPAMPLTYFSLQFDSLSPETISSTLQVMCDCSLQVTFQIADDHSVLRWSSVQLVNLGIRSFT